MPIYGQNVVYHYGESSCLRHYRGYFEICAIIWTTNVYANIKYVFFAICWEYLGICVDVENLLFPVIIRSVQICATKENCFNFLPI